MMGTGYTTLLNNAPSLQALTATSALRPFDPAAVSFVEAVSSEMLAMPQLRGFPELVALAYWMRKASLKRLKDTVQADIGDRIVVPRGLAFHIAPSNVDSIFVYTWFISLLAGNLNVVRVSSRESVQTRILVDTLNAVLARPEHEAIARRALLVQYDPDPLITRQFSDACQIRVIWGGDQTVAQIREVPLPATATEIAFANKHSLALVEANQWIEATDQERRNAIHAFFNDVFWFNQMACSSPRMLLWVGKRDSVERARSAFWTGLEKLIEAEGTKFEAEVYMRKLLAVDEVAIKTEHVLIETARNNVLMRVWQERPDFHCDHHCGHGLLIESIIGSLSELAPLLDRSVQTVSYYGIDPTEFRAFLATSPVRGIDRIVPFGKALDFAPVWDGFDLFRSFTREITID